MAAFLILPTYFKCGEALVREDPDSETKYLRLDAQWEILAHGYGRFEVLLAFLAHEFPPQVRGPGHGTEEEEGGGVCLGGISFVGENIDSATKRPSTMRGGPHVVL